MYIIFIRGGLNINSKRVKNPESPDIDLEVEQLQELNREFYQNYYSSYFGTKLTLLGSLYTNPIDFLSIIDSKGIKIDVYETKQSIERTELEKFTKLELSILYYHCIETFLRLFIAYAECNSVIWLEFARDRDYKKFKEKVKKIANGNFTFRGNGLDYFSKNIFYGLDIINDFEFPENTKLETAIDILKEWLVFSSNEILEVYEYNSFKHGLSVYVGSNSKYYSENDINNEDGKIDCLVYINKCMVDGRYKWQKCTVFTPLYHRAVIVHILQGLINNMITVGKKRCGISIEEESLVVVGSSPKEFYDVVKKKSPLASKANKKTKELRYYAKNSD